MRVKAARPRQADDAVVDAQVAKHRTPRVGMKRDPGDHAASRTERGDQGWKLRARVPRVRPPATVQRPLALRGRSQAQPQRDSTKTPFAGWCG